MKQVEMYTRSGCGFCDQAKQHLDNRGISYVEYNVYEQPEAFAQMSRRTVNRTYPQIFINNQNIGGFVELLKFETNQHF